MLRARVVNEIRTNQTCGNLVVASRSLPHCLDIETLQRSPKERGKTWAVNFVDTNG